MGEATWADVYADPTLAELLRLLSDGRPWTKVALRHAADLSETGVTKAMRALADAGFVTSEREPCECCGSSVVRYRAPGVSA